MLGYYGSGLVTHRRAPLEERNMTRSALGLALALTCVVPVKAAAVDWRALAEECLSYQADQEVRAYLEGNLRAAWKVEKVTGILREANDGYRELKERARTERSRRTAMMMLAVGGSKTSASLQDALSASGGDESPASLDVQAAEMAQVAREALVELVETYRAIKQDIDAQKRAREEAKRTAKPDAGGRR